MSILESDKAGTHHTSEGSGAFSYDKRMMENDSYKLRGETRRVTRLGNFFEVLRNNVHYKSSPNI